MIPNLKGCHGCIGEIQISMVGCVVQWVGRDYGGSMGCWDRCIVGRAWGFELYLVVWWYVWMVVTLWFGVYVKLCVWYKWV